MGYTLAQKIIKEHLVDGEMVPGSEIGLKIDQTLTQDATGTMAYLEFEAMGIECGHAQGRGDLSGKNHPSGCERFHFPRLQTGLRLTG